MVNDLNCTIDIVDHQNFTPISYAAKYKQPRIKGILLKALGESEIHHSSNISSSSNIASAKLGS